MREYLRPRFIMFVSDVNILKNVGIIKMHIQVIMIPCIIARSIPSEALLQAFSLLFAPRKNELSGIFK